MRRAAPVSAPDIDVAVKGELPPDAAAYTRDKVAVAIRHAHRPVLYARARLTGSPGPARRGVTAQANVDLNGRMVRAQVVASTAREAVDQLQQRLRQGIERAVHHWEPRRGGVPAAPRRQMPDSADEPEIIRRKSFVLARCTVDEAAFDLDAMDYDFHLFTEIGTGQDSLVYRAGPTGYRLAQLRPEPHRLARFATPVTVSPQPAPTLDLAQAIDRFTLTGLPFLFFREAGHGRGGVLYRRYNGHYGLISAG
jgi:hypothetical protein